MIIIIQLLLRRGSTEVIVSIKSKVPGMAEAWYSHLKTSGVFRFWVQGSGFRI